MTVVYRKNKNNAFDVKNMFDGLQERNRIVRATAIQFINEDDYFRFYASESFA